MSKIPNEIIEAEIVSEEIVELKQEPIILYSAVEAKGKEVQERIASLNIETLEPTNNNLQIIKKTRSSLNKEFKELEDKRKMIKELVMKPYNDFEEAYKLHIQQHFKDADSLLKSKVTVIEDEILTAKIKGIEEYFNEVNTFDFININDVVLDIKKSVSDKKLKEQIDEFMLNVANDLATIDTLQNKERVLAKYQIVKDLNRAISDVNVELQREEHIRKQEQERKEREDLICQREEQIKQQCEDMNVIPKEEVQEPIIDEQVHDVKVYKTSFRVTATLEDIKALKQFMEERGIKYESIK